MTATERVCELLDERGVEYRTHGTTDRTWFEVGNISWFVIERENGNLTADAVFLTPEQAVAVTLGSCNCSNDCTNGERTDVPCLPHFWTHDGTLHIEATRMPTRIVVCEGGTCEFVPKRELDTSEAENAKLRELVDGWDFCSKTKSSTFDNCVGCPLFIQTLHSYRCARDERMRELGIEVDDA